MHAVETVLKGLPPGLPAAVLVMLHLSPEFPSLLAELLGRHVQRAVRDAADGDTLRPGMILAAPRGVHTLITDRCGVRLSRGEPVRFSRPSADALLGSAAAHAPRGVIAAVLSGSGRDGADGAAALRRAGGIVLVQDPETAEFSGMPGAVVAAGAFDETLALGSIAPRIIARLGVDGGPGS